MPSPQPRYEIQQGGFALDLRLAERARTTKDIDIDWLPAQDELLDTLIEAAERDMSDFFSFSIERTGPPADHRRIPEPNSIKHRADHARFTASAAAAPAYSISHLRPTSRGCAHPSLISRRT